MPKPSGFEMRIENIVIPKNRPIGIEVIENNISIFNVGGSVLRRKILKHPDGNEVGQNEGKQQYVFTMLQPSPDAIPDFHLPALERLPIMGIKIGLIYTAFHTFPLTIFIR